MAHSRRDGEYYWIFGNENARIVSIKSALSAGIPVCFGTIIYDAVLKTDGVGPIDKPTSSSSYLGGHAMCIVGYEQSSSGLKFEILNSWGKDWGDGGFGWFTEDYIRWSLSRDFVIIRGWRRLRKDSQ
jgi:C1A family cysteine protease